MGRDKSMLPHPNGGRFIDHAIEQLRPVCDEVCIAGSPDSRPDQTRGVFLADEVAFRGPITGVVNAIRYAVENSFDACLVTPVDMPSLTTQHLSKLVERWTQNRQLTCAVNVSGQRQPLIGIYPSVLTGPLDTLAQSKNRSLNRWLQNQPHQTVLLPDDANHNVNRPADLDP